jgi:hypothetical protein
MCYNTLSAVVQALAPWPPDVLLIALNWVQLVVAWLAVGPGIVGICRMESSQGMHSGMLKGVLGM